MGLIRNYQSEEVRRITPNHALAQRLRTTVKGSNPEARRIAPSLLPDYDNKEVPFRHD